MTLNLIQTVRSLYRHCAGITLAFLVAGISGCSSPALKPWHTVELDEEFTADMVVDGRVQACTDYLVLEDRLFRHLEDEI